MFFNLNVQKKNINQRVLPLPVSVPNLVKTHKDLEGENNNHHKTPCSACPGSKNLNANFEKKESKYIKENILDSNIFLQNKYNRNVVNLDGNIDNISNNIKKIIQNHYIK